MASEKELSIMNDRLLLANAELTKQINDRDAVLKDIRDWIMYSGVDAYQNCEYGESARHAFYLMESEISQAKDMAKTVLKE